MCNLLFYKLFLQGMMSIKIAVLIMLVWFTLSQEYALPLNYTKKPPGGFLWNARFDYNIVTTSIITGSHIFSVQDLSSRLSFPNVALCLSTTSTETFTQCFN